MAATLSMPSSSITSIILNGVRLEPRNVPPLVSIPEKSS